MNLDAEMQYEDGIATLGDRIEAAREALEMTRGDLAERLGVKKSTIKKWENDQSEPRSNRLYMLAGVLNCNVMWLLNGEGDAPLQASEGSNIDAKRSHLKAELADLSRSILRISDRIEKIKAEL